MAPPNSDGSTTTSPPAGSRLAQLGRTLLWLVFPITLGLAITRQSLWIDEGFTVWFASRESIASFFSALLGAPGPPGDPQLIFYLLYMWGWIKLFGTSELVLRAANIPFAILFIGTMSWASRRLLRRPYLWVFFCLSPFFWFYLNEARPYVALLAFSSVASVALLAYLICPAEYKTLAPWCCLVGLFFAWGTHIMAAFLFPAMVASAAATVASEPSVRQNFFKDWRRPALWCSPAFVALGVFYIWTASSHGINRGYGRPRLSSLVYVLYEFTGFGGLGPPRNDIRENLHLSVFVPYWPLLLTGLAALVGFCFLLLRMPPPKIARSATIGVLTGMVAAVAVSMIEDFWILARHMAMFFPLFLLTPMLWLKHSSRAKVTRYVGAAALITLGVAWGISDARLVFLNKYAKDSYRDASSIALARVRLDQGKILWAADPYTANYYGIQVMKDMRPVLAAERAALDRPVAGQAVDVRNWSLEEATAYLDASTTPIVLVLSKADPFDPKGVWRTLIQKRKLTNLALLPAFTVYDWQPLAAVHSDTHCGAGD
jgi:hypothetical protein